MIRVVAINSPWVKDRLKGINDFYGLDFVFDYVDITVDKIPYQALPYTSALAVLDINFVSKYKKGFTFFVAPYADTGIQGRALPSGLYLPPLSSWKRWEWFFTRFFWDSPVIQVFANEKDKAFVNGKDLGGAFELWSIHEFSHFFYETVVLKTDNTHKYFYMGQPEKARDEIIAILKPLVPALAPEPHRDLITAFAMAIQKHEGYFEGSRAFRNKNPANAKYVGQPDAVGEDKDGFAIFPSYEIGFAYLCRVLRNACTGKSTVYRPDMDLYQFFAIYAPASDNNNSKHYAETVALAMGVKPTDRISTFV